MHVQTGQAHARCELALDSRDRWIPELLHWQPVGHGEVFRSCTVRTKLWYVCCSLSCINGSRCLRIFNRFQLATDIHYSRLNDFNTVSSLALEGVTKQNYENTYGVKQVQDGVRVSSYCSCITHGGHSCSCFKNDYELTPHSDFSLLSHMCSLALNPAQFCN